MILKAIDQAGANLPLAWPTSLMQFFCRLMSGQCASTPRAQEQQLEKLLHLLRFSSTCLGS